VNGDLVHASDRRIKSNIVPANLEYSTEIVKRLKLRHFEWAAMAKEGKPAPTRTAWIAQEVEEVLPEAVRSNDAYGIPDCKFVAESAIVSHMFGALQKALAEIDALKSALARVMTHVGL
jgi:hypothetical protein